MVRSLSKVAFVGTRRAGPRVPRSVVSRWRNPGNRTAANLHDGRRKRAGKAPVHQPNALEGGRRTGRLVAGIQACGCRSMGVEMSRAWMLFQKYAFAIVPAVGLFELALHWKQTRSVPTDAEWEAARAEVQ